MSIPGARVSGDELRNASPIADATGTRTCQTAAAVNAEFAVNSNAPAIAVLAIAARNRLRKLSRGRDSGNDRANSHRKQRMHVVYSRQFTVNRKCTVHENKSGIWRVDTYN